MRSHVLLPPLLLLALDTAPQLAAPDSSGTRVAVGAGLGSYEHMRFSCDGGVTRADPVRLETAGVLFEKHKRTGRLAAYGGYVGSPDDALRGAYAGLFAAVEGRYGGAGLGLVLVPAEGRRPAPSLYLRGGPHRYVHLRLELFPPTEVLGVTGFLRLGLGWNQGRDPGPRFAAGLAAGPYSYPDVDTVVRGYLDADVPIGDRHELRFRFQAGPGLDRLHLAGAVGLSLPLR